MQANRNTDASEALVVNLRVLIGDCRQNLKLLKENSIQTVVTSPPYWGLRDYGEEEQIGLETSPEEYVANLVQVFQEVRRVLKSDGTVWLNLGDSYSRGFRNRHSEQKGVCSTKKDGEKYGFEHKKQYGAIKPKELVGIPWRVAFALQADGWYLRQDIIWSKPNPMPESVRDRCTKAHEYLFLLTKEPKYFYDKDAIREDATYHRHVGKIGDNRGARTDKRRGTEANSMSGGHSQYRNKRSVWTVNTRPYAEAHFAVFPPELIEPCILAGSSKGDLVLDPFGGSGTTAAVALKHGRRAIVCELNPDYAELIENRIGGEIHGRGWVKWSKAKEEAEKRKKNPETTQENPYQKTLWDL